MQKPGERKEERKAMLKHPTEERLAALGLTGMAKALEEQRRQPDIAALSFEERFALLVDREATERDNKRLLTRLRYASLRQNADAILDRLVHNAHRLNLKGESLRKPAAKRQKLDAEPAK